MTSARGYGGFPEKEQRFPFLCCGDRTDRNSEFRQCHYNGDYLQKTGICHAAEYRDDQCTASENAYAGGCNRTDDCLQESSEEEHCGETAGERIGLSL